MGFVRFIWTITRRLLIFLVLLLTFLSSVLVALYFSRTKEVPVPKLVGRSAKDALILARRHGLKVEVIEVSDEKEKLGVVLRQDPKAGMIVKKGFTVRIYLNKANGDLLLRKEVKEDSL